MPTIKIKKDNKWEYAGGGSPIEIDETLSIQGAAADAKVTGEALTDVVYVNNEDDNSATLFSDKEKTSSVFPRTKTSAVSNEDGVKLDVLLNELKESLSNVSTSETFAAILPANGWIVESSAAGIYKQEITVEGLLSEDVPIIDINNMADSISFEEKIERLNQWNYVYGGHTNGADKLVVRMLRMPTVDIPIQIKVVR